VPPLPYRVTNSLARELPTAASQLRLGPATWPHCAGRGTAGTRKRPCRARSMASRTRAAYWLPGVCASCANTACNSHGRHTSNPPALRCGPRTATPPTAPRQLPTRSAYRLPYVGVGRATVARPLCCVTPPLRARARAGPVPQPLLCQWQCCR
jgi:hypothetical protein